MLPHESSGLSRWRHAPRPSHLGILLLLALLVPAAVVAVVGVASLRSEAVAREHMLNESYRQVAEIAAAQLDNHIAALEAEVAAALEAEVAATPAGEVAATLAGHEASRSPEALIGALRGLQNARPWLRPALLVRSDGTLVYPPSSRAVAVPGSARDDGTDREFRRAFDAAEAAELRGGDLRVAVGL